ncbi:MAG: hypothetical protein JXA01_10910 [Dehalococcoidia bacterium]|nr:hypothetical protein [Dehalococcoidia bacterium]
MYEESNAKPGSYSIDNMLSDWFLKPTLEGIVGLQEKQGSVPELAGGIVEPWTHVECAMAIDAGNYHDEAERAYKWLADVQLADGSWYANYQYGLPRDLYKVSHAISYIAVGVLHHYIITGDLKFVRDLWPSVRSAINFILEMRGPDGEIYWARDVNGQVYPSAQIASCSSSYLSIKCALRIAEMMGEEYREWMYANERLRYVILRMPLPYATPANGENISAFAMDWYYPALCSVINGQTAVSRIYESWDKFIVHGKGSVCNLEKMWVTAAETSELAMSLALHGEYRQAAVVYNWIHHMRDDDGAYWYGIAYPENEIWPLEKPSWTSAAVVLAADMLRPMSSTSILLDHNSSTFL